jgi:cbb3-type cytochrome oxidase subunit 3
MDINLIRIIVTLAVVVFFIGIVWWAYAPSHRERFERDGRLPFDEPEVPQSNNGAGK